MKILWLALLALCTLPACGSSDSQTSAAPKVTPTTAFKAEVVVRTFENFKNAADVNVFVAMAARSHIDAISLLVKQDEDSGVIPSGQVYYRSRLAPIATGYANFDVLQAMLDAAHPKGIKVRAWLPQFHDQAAARLHPAWQMMALQKGHVAPYTGSGNTEYFLNPLNSEVQQYEMSLIREVAANYAVDGVMLDWIRFDNFNMDLGDVTRSAYHVISGIDPATIDFSTASAARNRWNEFRTDGIAAYVGKVRGDLPAAIPVGLYILPPEFVEVAQDAAKFNAQVSAIAPMCYYRDWGFTLDWVWNSCLASTARKAGSSAVVPTMDSNLTDDQYRAIMLHLRQDFPRISTLAWFQHERWTETMMQRIAVISSW